MSNDSGYRRLSEFLDRMLANGDTVYAGVEDWYGTPIVKGEGHYYQWDRNQKLLILIPDSWTPQLSYRMYDPDEYFTELQAAEAAFGYPNQEMYRRDQAPKALGRLITAMNKHWLEFEVPNKALEKSGEMWAYVTVTSEHHTMTEFIVKIMVLPRVKPEPYQSLNDPDSVAKVLALLIDARDRAEEAAGKAEDYYNQMIEAGATLSQISNRVANLEECCNEMKEYIPPPFELDISAGTYGYKDAGGTFHPFKHPSGTLTLSANTGSSGVSTEYGTNGAYYEKVIVDVDSGPGPTVHTTTYTPVVENDSGSGNDMGESHTHRYVDTTGFYKVDQGTKMITQNISSPGEDVTRYSRVIVNVPASGYNLSGTKRVTENGTYSTIDTGNTAFANFEIEVSSSGEMSLGDLKLQKYVACSKIDDDSTVYDYNIWQGTQYSASKNEYPNNPGNQSGTVPRTFVGYNSDTNLAYANAPQDLYKVNYWIMLGKYAPSATLITLSVTVTGSNRNTYTFTRGFTNFRAKLLELYGGDLTPIETLTTGEIYKQIINSGTLMVCSGTGSTGTSHIFGRSIAITGLSTLRKKSAMRGSWCFHGIYATDEDLQIIANCQDRYSAAQGADARTVATEWSNMYNSP